MSSRARIVFFKELRETFRDRRVIIGVVLWPLLVTPLMFLGIGFFAGQKDRSDKAEVLPVALVGEAAAPALAGTLAKNEAVRLTLIPDRAAAEAAVRAQTVRAALVLPEDAGTTMAAGGTVEAEVLFDAANDKSRTARDRLQRAVDGFEKQELLRRLGGRGLDAAFVDPVKLTPRNLASERRTGGFILSAILPVIVIFSAAFGGMTSAFDLCAGEKERGTMETLLVSPASRYEIILGKLGTIGVVSVLSAFCSVAGMVIAFQVGFVAASALGLSALAISYTSVGAMLAMVVPLAVMTSSLLLLVSTFARNQKEAQAQIYPVLLLVMVPTMLSMIFGPESGLTLAFVPILNTALVMKQVLIGLFNPAFLAVALLSSVVYAALAMRLVVAMFQRESVLFRT